MPYVAGIATIRSLRPAGSVAVLYRCPLLAVAAVLLAALGGGVL